MNRSASAAFDSTPQPMPDPSPQPLVSAPPSLSTSSSTSSGALHPADANGKPPQPSHSPQETHQETHQGTRQLASIWIQRPAAVQFLSRVEQSATSAAAAEGNQPLVFHLHGVRGVGKSAVLQRFAQSTSGNLALLTFGQTAGLETPIGLMVKLFEALVEQNNWIFKPKFLVMYDRYQRALQELRALPLDGADEVGPQQQALYQELRQLEQQPGLFEQKQREEQSTAARVAAENRREKMEALLHQHRATQHDQTLQELLLDPLGALTRSFVQALQKRSKRQPLILILDAYEKATLTVDTWIWYRLLPELAEQKTAVRFVLASHERLSTRSGWNCLPDGLLLEQELAPFEREEVQAFWQQALTPAQPETPEEPELSELEAKEEIEADSDSHPKPSAAPDLRSNTGEHLPAHSDSNSGRALDGDWSEGWGENWSEQLLMLTQGLPCGLERARQHLLRPRTASDEPSVEALLAPQANLLILMEQGLTLIQRHVVQLAACCRSFNRDLIDYLLSAQDSNFALALETTSDGFDWLIQQDFVEQIEGCWRLNDMARNLFRQSLLLSDESLFYTVQQQLEDYFWQRSNEVIAPNTSPRQRYSNRIWQRGRAEYLYHLLLSNHPQAEFQLLQHLLEGHYFGIDHIAQEVWSTLASEYPIDENPLLSVSIRVLLQKLEPTIAFTPLLLNRESIPYDELEHIFGLSEDRVDQAVRACFQGEHLPEKFARFVALFYESKQCLKGEQLQILQQAEAVAKELLNPADPVFNSQLLLWGLGDRYSTLGAYEAAVSAYQQATEFQPDNPEAWDNCGSSLGCLGRYEEAVASFDRALELDSEAHDVWHSRGLALARAERYEEAIASFDRALSVKPNKHQPWYDKACCYALQHLSTLALESLEKAITLHADYQAMAKRDPDLAALRSTLTFDRLVNSNQSAQSLDG